MSARKTDRHAVWLAGAAAILPATMLPALPARVEAAEPSAFAPPAGPMMLTRVLRRPLPGGIEVVTIRSYEITIRADGEGYLIDGKLVDVRTEVPAAYEALARLERERPDVGLFPIRLDARGRMLPGQELSSPPVPAAAVGNLALKRIDNLGLASQDAGDARDFVRAVSANPARTAWPEDLFRPAPGARSDTRAVPLPNGETGQVAVRIDASADRRDGLLDSFRRVVTTNLGGAERVTQETWTLERKS